MNEQAGTANGTDEQAGRANGTDEDGPMDAAQAAAIMQQAGDRARHEFGINHRRAFATWGVLIFIGYGLIWLTVHGQRPYHGLKPGAFEAICLISTFVAFTAVGSARSDRGVGGRSSVRWLIHVLAIFAGYAAMFTLEGALDHAGAGRPVLGVFQPAAPIIVLGLVYLTTAAYSMDWPVAGLGIWLIVVAATGGFAGPVTVWAIDALAVGLAFLVVAAIPDRLRQSPDRLRRS
jgi:hypothetical protein